MPILHVKKRIPKLFRLVSIKSPEQQSVINVSFFLFLPHLHRKVPLKYENILEVSCIPGFDILPVAIHRCRSDPSHISVLDIDRRIPRRSCDFCETETEMAKHI